MQNNLLQLSGVDLVVPTHGIEGAKSYPMGPNCRVPLFDDSEDILYIKSTDSNGFPTIREFELKERIHVDADNSGNGVALEDIRSLIREELSAVLNKEDNSNGQQSIPAANSESTKRNEPGNTTTVKHNGNAKSANTNAGSNSGKQRQNSSIMEYSKEQQ